MIIEDASSPESTWQYRQSSFPPVLEPGPQLMCSEARSAPRPRAGPPPGRDRRSRHRRSHRQRQGRRVGHGRDREPRRPGQEDEDPGDGSNEDKKLMKTSPCGAGLPNPTLLWRPGGGQRVQRLAATPPDHLDTPTQRTFKGARAERPGSEQQPQG